MVDENAALEPWVERLTEAARNGVPLRSGDGERSRVPAEAIRLALTRPDLNPDARGLEVLGCDIVGLLDLSAVNVPCSLTISDSTFDHSPNFRRAIIPELHLSSVQLPGIILDFSEIKGCIDLSKSNISGLVSAENMRVKGYAHFSQTEFRTQGELAMSLLGSEINGQIELVHAKFWGSISAENMVIGGSILLAGTTITTSNSKALVFNRSKIGSNVTFDEKFSAKGSVHFASTVIGGNLTIEGELRTSSGSVLDFRSSKVEGDVNLGRSGALISWGQINAESCQIGGDLFVSGARIYSPDGIALRLRSSSVKGDMRIDQRSEVDGQIAATSTEIGGNLIVGTVTLNNPGATALSLQSATISGNVYILAKARIYGGVIADYAQVGGELSLGGRIFNKGGDAVSLFEANVKTGILLVRGLEIEGGLQAHQMRAGAVLSEDGIRIYNPGQMAIVLADAKILGHVSLAHIEIDGSFYAAAANVSGDLTLEGTRIFASQTNAVDISDIRVAGRTFFDDKVLLDGSLYAADARFEGTFILNGRIRNSGGSAVFMNKSVFGNTMRLGQAFTADGAVVAVAARFDAQLNLRGSTIGCRQDGIALDLHGAKVENLFLGGFQSAGSVRLAYADIGILVAPESATCGDSKLPLLAGAAGWKIRGLQGCLRRDARLAVMWLDSADLNDRPFTRFMSEPWKELADTYVRMGQVTEGRNVRYEAAKRTTKAAPRVFKPLRWLYQWSVGYGYHPLRVLAWMASAFLLALALATGGSNSFSPVDKDLSKVLITDHEGHESHITGTTQPNPPGYPSFSPYLTALETSIPAVDTGQTKYWKIDDPLLQTALGGIRAVSWVLAALLLAGVTGLLKKD